MIAHTVFDFCVNVNVNELWELCVTREQSQYLYVNAFCKVVRGPSIKRTLHVFCVLTPFVSLFEMANMVALVVWPARLGNRDRR